MTSLLSGFSRQAHSGLAFFGSIARESFGSDAAQHAEAEYQAVFATTVALFTGGLAIVLIAFTRLF